MEFATALFAKRERCLGCFLRMNRPLARPSAFAKATADRLGTLSPAEGERDGVRGPLASPGVPCAHNLR